MLAILFEHGNPALGATAEGDRISFPVTGVDGGSASMLTVQVG